VLGSGIASSESRWPARGGLARVQRCWRSCVRAPLVCACSVGVAGCGGSKAGFGANIPAGVHLIEVVSVGPGAQPQVAVALTRSAQVREVVVWIDRMRPVPSGVAYSSAMHLAGEPVVTLVLRTGSQVRS
jgi:hypothetical protein